MRGLPISTCRSTVILLQSAAVTIAAAYWPASRPALCETRRLRARPRSGSSQPRTARGSAAAHARRAGDFGHGRADGGRGRTDRRLATDALVSLGFQTALMTARVGIGGVNDSRIARGLERAGVVSAGAGTLPMAVGLRPGVSAAPGSIVAPAGGYQSLRLLRNPRRADAPAGHSPPPTQAPPRVAIINRNACPPALGRPQYRGQPDHRRWEHV